MRLVTRCMAALSSAAAAAVAVTGATPTPPLRALCLHGWRTNDKLMRFQTARLQRAFGKDRLELVFLNAPHQSPGAAAPMIEQLVSPPFFEWWDRCDLGQGNEYVGLAESLALVQRTVEEQGPFDLLVGFSQGGIFSTLLTALLEQPDQIRRLDTPNSPAAPFALQHPWKLVVLVCAMAPRDHRIDGLLGAGTLKTPSVHIFGEKDAMLPASRALVEHWDNSEGQRTETSFPEGHQFPSNPEPYDLVKEAVARHCRAAKADGQEEAAPPVCEAAKEQGAEEAVPQPEAPTETSAASHGADGSET